MNKLEKKDLLSLEDYSLKRDTLRTKVLDIKRKRKVQIGSNVTLLFENKETIKYEMHEMLMVKKIFQPEGIEEELSAYNPLIPNGSNLKATLLIEFPDEKIRREMLKKLIGIENKVWLQIGENKRVFGIADEDLDRSSEDKTSAVHFLRFELSQLMIKEFKRGETLFSGINHRNYNVRTREISKNISNSLSKDLS